MEWMLLPLRRYAEFSGRSRRMEFWMFFVFQVLMWIAFTVLAMVLFGGGVMMMGANGGMAASSSIAAMGVGVLALYGLEVLVVLAFFIPNLAVAVRRLHDSDRSGWWVLAPFAGYLLMMASALSGSRMLAMVGMLAVAGLSIALLVFYFLEGTVGPNRFGPDPKGRVNPQVFA